MNQSSVGTTLDVQSFINAQPLSRYQWRVVILCFLIVFLDGLDTAAMGFIAPALSQDWGIDRASLGPAMSAALIGMVFGALGSGPLADRFGRKMVLVGAVLVFGAFSLASAYASNVDQLLVLRFLTGLGLGAGMPNATTLLSEYTPERLKSLLVKCRTTKSMPSWLNSKLPRRLSCRAKTATASILWKSAWQTTLLAASNQQR